LITLILLFWLGFEYFFFFEKTSRRLNATRYRQQYGPDLVIFSIQFCVTGLFFWQLRAPETALHLPAFIFIFCGLLLRWYAIQILGKYFTADLAVFNEHPIVEAGPYKLIRHPQYVGGWMTFLGAGFLCPAPARFLVCLIPLLAFGIKSYWEEKALAQIWGERYLKFRQRTRLVLPYLF